MLPDGDCLPESCYKATKLINDLGLTYVKIDACPNNCVIYWKDTAKLNACSVCGESRYKNVNEEDGSRKKKSQLRLCELHSPVKEINVYMHPLIDELNELWELLSLAIHAVLPKSVTMILLELSAIFRQLCSKKESDEGFKQLNSRIALTLCQLEKIFPLAFFDVMMYLPVHLADEVAIVGPVQYRWMYPIERYLQTLNRYVRNKGHPEGSIVEVCLVDECLSFCSMYLGDVKSRRTRRGQNEDGIGRGVSGGQHEEFLKNQHRRARLTVRQIKELSKKQFPEWFKQHINSRCHSNYILIFEDLHWLANYPSRFRTKSVDDKHKNQNYGVFVLANVFGAIGQVNCYGRVIDMFECEWVNSESPRGMKTDQYGFTLVNFNQLGFKEDPFILASQAFYVEDTIEKDWHVVVRTQPRDLFDVLKDNDALDDYAIFDLDDRVLDNENLHTRVGVEETPFHEVLPLPTQFPDLSMPTMT
ncbi:unnamed protein product [Malus baccata var. baccata]